MTDNASRLLQKAAEEIPPPLSPDARSRQRARVVEHAHRSPSTPLFSWRSAVVATSVLVAAGAVWFTTGKPNSLKFRIQGETDYAEVGAWVRANTEPVEIFFEQESRVGLSPGTSLRVVDSTHRQVQIILEKGRIEADINKNSSDWSLSAGPYQIHVIGTVFTADWRPERASLTVEVTRGDVEVQNPTTRESVRVSSGRTLVAEEGYIELKEIKPAGEETELKEIKPAVEETELKEESNNPGRRKRRTHRPQWQQLLERGQCPEGLERARTAGVLRRFHSLKLDELVQLTKLARCAGAAPEATAALRAIRSRFPKASDARTAAFLLGRVAMELNDAPERAAEWFERYLRESPHGALTEEASGRLIKAHQLANNTEAARRAANHYLELYPEGLFIDRARNALESP